MHLTDKTRQIQLYAEAVLCTLLGVTAAALGVSLAFPQFAYAYVDPSVMTYTIQALAGVAVALSAVAGVAFRRSRKALMKALGIDENAKKSVDPDIYRVMQVDGEAVPITPTSADGAPTIAPTVRMAAADSVKTAAKPEKRMSWPKRFLIAICVCALASFTVLFVAPVEIIAASAGSLALPLSDIWPIIAPVCAAVFAVGAIVLSIFRGKPFAVLVALVFCFGLCCWVQAMFLNGGLPAADGHTIQWVDFRTSAFISFAIWAALFAVGIVVAVKGSRIGLIGMAALSIALVVVQAVGVGSIFVDSAAKQMQTEVRNDPIYVTERGLFTVNPQNNIVVFVLDTYDTAELERQVRSDSELLDGLTGFTWYQDSLAMCTPTRYAIPYLLTGVEPRTDEQWGEYTRQRYERSDALAQMKGLGWSVGIYSDSIYFEDTNPGIGWSRIADNTINVGDVALSESSISKKGVIAQSIKMALYRDLLWPMKPFFTFNTNEVNNGMMNTSSLGESAVYVMDDGGYYAKLKTIGLTAIDEAEAGAFRLIHLDGVHVPYTLDKNGEYSPSATYDTQSYACWNMVGEYLDDLRALGLYDSATIIITADHGYWESPQYPVDYAMSPIMLVKPAQNAEEASRPLQISDAPVSHADFLPAVFKAMGADGSAYGSGIAFDDVTDFGRVRTYYQTYYDADNREAQKVQYEVVGDALSLSNWTETGEEWRPQQ